jgi:hypothetical protein
MSENSENDSFNILENIKNVFSNPFESDLNYFENDSNFLYEDIFFITKKEKSIERKQNQFKKENEDINKNLNLFEQNKSEARIIPQNEIIIDIKGASKEENSINKKILEMINLPNP